MEFRRLGRSGLKVSVAGIGCNNFGMRIDEEASGTVVRAALEAGVTLFDTADVYGNGRSEEFLGRALGAERSRVIVATKFAWPMGEGPYEGGTSRRYIMRAVEASLRRLGTDYIDLYQVHRPDWETPIEETLDALNDLVRDGKVRYIGSSAFTAWQIADADWAARTRHLSSFISAQNEWSMLERSIEPDVVPACERFGLGVLPYFPLANGFLSGKYRRGEAFPTGSRLEAWKDRYGHLASDENFTRLEKLTAYAEDRGHTMLDLAIAWLATRPVVSSVIAGATSPEQVTANAAAAADWRLTDSEMEEVNAVLAPVGYPA